MVPFQIVGYMVGLDNALDLTAHPSKIVLLEGNHLISTSGVTQRFYESVLSFSPF